jgi:hypothetical protein
MRSQSGGRARWGGAGTTALIWSPGQTSPAFRYDRHDAGPEAWPGRAALQAVLQSGPEAIDEDAGRAEASEFKRRRGAEPKHRAQREACEVEPDRRDVLAEISGADFESGPLERSEQFARDEVDLPEVRRLRIAASQVSVPHVSSAMRIAFDAMAAGQCNRQSRRLAEAMLVVDRHGDHHALGSRVLPLSISDF